MRKGLIMGLILLVSSPVLAKTPVCSNPSRLPENLIMACNIYNEAKSESIQGKFAVGFVTINRSMTKGYPNTVSKVILEKTSGVYQYSWVPHPVSPKSSAEMVQWEISQKVANFLIYLRNTPDYYDLDFTQGSTSFHALAKNPWPYLHETVKIGGHRFYVDRRGLRKSTKSYCDLTSLAGFDYCPGRTKESLIQALRVND